MDIYEYRRKRLTALIKSEYQVRKNVADASGWSEARISQILSPTYRAGRAFSEKVARKLEADLGLKAMYFDDLAVPISVDASRVDVEAKAPEIIFVPLCRISIREGARPTEAVEVVNVGQQFAPYAASWLKEMGIYQSRAALFRAPDDSMAPRFTTDDVVLADCSDTDIVDGRMYVIRYGKSLKIRYLSLRLDKTLILRSLSPSYPDEHLGADVAQEHITIVGRVREIKVYSNL